METFFPDVIDVTGAPAFYIRQRWDEYHTCKVCYAKLYLFKKWHVNIGFCFLWFLKLVVEIWIYLRFQINRFWDSPALFIKDKWKHVPRIWCLLILIEYVLLHFEKRSGMPTKIGMDFSKRGFDFYKTRFPNMCCHVQYFCEFFHAFFMIQPWTKVNNGKHKRLMWIPEQTIKIF